MVLKKSPPPRRLRCPPGPGVSPCCHVGHVTASQPSREAVAGGTVTVAATAPRRPTLEKGRSFSRSRVPAFLLPYGPNGLSERIARARAASEARRVPKARRVRGAE